MTDRQPSKKSDMLEVRLTHHTKSAFMDKARADGRPASEIVREQIDAYLSGAARPRPRLAAPMDFLRRHARAAMLLAAAGVTALAMGVAVSPANAQPDLQSAFAALDANGDGVVSLAEFVNPQRALATDVTADQSPGAGRIAIASPKAGSPVYVRYMLDTGTDEGVLPLLVVIDLPKDGMAGADIGDLVSKAFAALDRNGDGRLSADEFTSG